MSRPRMLEDWQWDKIKPYLPVKVASRKGGRPRAGDRECLEGILWVLKTGARWRVCPPGFPPPVRVGGGWSSGRRRESSMICGSPSSTRWMNKAR